MPNELCTRGARSIGAWVLTVAIGSTAAARADDVFYRVSIGDLKFSEGKLPADEQLTSSRRIPWISYRSFRPYAVLDGEGEAYVSSPGNTGPWMSPVQSTAQAFLCVHVAAPRKIAGVLYWPKNDWSGMQKLRFAIETEPSSEAKTEFAQAKQAHYLELMARGAAGTAWFRHQVRQVRAGLKQATDQSDPIVWNPNRIDQLDQTFDLLSGGQAISENLQLDRVLQRVTPGDDKVPLDSLKGITVAEIDWKPLIKGLQPAQDSAREVLWFRRISTLSYSPASKHSSKCLIDLVSRVRF